MKKRMVIKAFCVCLLLSIILTACGSPAPVPSTAPPAVAKATEIKKIVTSTGFECPEPNPKMEVSSDKLNLFVWTEYIPADWIECFELVYGIKVNRDEYSSNEEMYAKLSSGGSSYDLVQPTDYIVQLMVRQGLLQKIDKSKLSVLSTFDPNFMNLPFDPGNEYTIPYEGGTDAIVYNADTVSNPPKSWEDLWNPDFAGRIILLDDSRAVIGFTLLTLGFDPNTKNPAELDQAKAKLAKLIPGVKIFDSDSPKTPLIAGDVDLGMTWTGEAFLAHQEKPSINYVYPTEGAILWQDNYAIPLDAPHPDAVYAWLNYTMQSDMFWMMLRDFVYNNPSLATLEYAKVNYPDLYKGYMESPITNPPPGVFKAGHRIEDVGDSTPLYDQIWTEVKGGQ